MTNIALLGSTGSIGIQTLDIVRNYPNLFTIDTLTAADNWEKLAHQAIEFKAKRVVIANEIHYHSIKQALKEYNIEILAGADALEEVVKQQEIDIVVVAIVGFAGLAPTIATIEAKKRLALANKESLVVGGEIVMRLARQNGVEIMPIDSEHSAIYQCLVGELTPPKRILLTASGGSLRDIPIEELKNVTPQRVLSHPVWDMGARITVDSATMLNKGFEIIEAAHLYSVKSEQIQVVVHPQSIIHSAVEFADGSIKAQISYPDMRLPIQYALTYPERMNVGGLQSFDPFITSTLTFQKPEAERYPCLELAYSALQGGGILPTVLNASGEIAVEAFLRGRIGFTDIARVVEKSLEMTNNEPLQNISEIYEADAEARANALFIIDN